MYKTKHRCKTIFSRIKRGRLFFFGFLKGGFFAFEIALGISDLIGRGNEIFGSAEKIEKQNCPYRAERAEGTDKFPFGSFDKFFEVTAHFLRTFFAVAFAVSAGTSFRFTVTDVELPR